MVFSSYNSTSYLPLDNDQSVTFYKNENRRFPTAIVPPAVPFARATDPSTASHGLNHMSNMSTTDMLTAAYEQQQQQHHHHHHDHHHREHNHRELFGGSGSGSLITGDCPFGRVQSPAGAAASATPHRQQQQQQHLHHHHRPSGGAVAMCDDFQPVAYLNGSSNGYYGYVPSLNNNNNNNRDTNHAPAPEENGNPPTELHLPSGRFHGNQGDRRQAATYQQHTGCDESELNDNNNNNNDDNDGHFGGGAVAASVEPFFTGNFLQHARKRKEVDQRYDEEMDTNAPATRPSDGASETKRRKTEPEPFAGPTNEFLFLGDGTVEDHRFRRQEQHQQPADDMECQEQLELLHPHQLATGSHPHPAQSPLPAGVNYTNGFHHPPRASAPTLQPDPTGASHDLAQQQHPNSKSKYFDSSRCMMSHMI